MYLYGIKSYLNRIKTYLRENSYIKELRQNKKAPTDKTSKEDDLPVRAFYFLNITL